MSRTSIPAKGRIAILLVTSRYRNKNTLLLDRHRGSSTDLSLYALNKKYIARRRLESRQRSFLFFFFISASDRKIPTSLCQCSQFLLGLS